MTVRPIRFSARCAAALAVAASLSWAPATTSAEHPDFSDKEITLVVPFSAGGGTDRWARFWAPLIAAELPGEPVIRIENIVGGGSTTGANRYYREAGRDGTMLFASSASVVLPFLLGDKRVEYDFSRWQALLASPTGGVVFANPDVVDADSYPVRFRPGAEISFLILGPTQVGALMMLSFEMLGLDYDARFGTGGSANTFRNFRSGQASVDMQTTASYKTRVARLEEQGDAVPVFTFGISSPTGVISRDPNFPNVPHFIEYYEEITGGMPEGTVFEVWKQFYFAGFPAQKILFLPKNTDEEILNAYRRAIMAVATHEDDWPNAKEDVLGDYVQYYNGEAASLAEGLRTMSPEVVEWYRDFVMETAGISL